MLRRGGNQGIRAGAKNIDGKGQPLLLQSVSNGKPITNLKNDQFEDTMEEDQRLLQVAVEKSGHWKLWGYWGTEDRNQNGDPERRHFSAIPRDQIRMTFLFAVCFEVRRS